MGLLVVFGLVTGSVHAEQISGAAPDFTLKSRSGKNLKLSEYRGQVVMLNFWASWCGPCRQEMPLLEQLYQRYQAMGFTILAVNVEDTSGDALKMLKDVPVNFPVLFDSDNRISDTYGIEAMPSTILVDRDGNMRFEHLGYMPGYENDYDREIKTLVGE
ncbi:MAG: redoxin domain-containing protein [Gammaproteobacteria bacterium]|nr:redoxin domain-containing protein [Gammaproteobacteria bacterium]